MPFARSPIRSPTAASSSPAPTVKRRRPDCYRISCARRGCDQFTTARVRIYSPGCSAPSPRPLIGKGGRTATSAPAACLSMLTINVPAAPAKVHFINVLRDWRHSSSLPSLAASPQFSDPVINEIANSRLNLSGSGFRCVPGSERCTFLDVRRPDLQSRRR